MSEVVPLPSFGEVFFDARGQDRVLRVTWHDGTLVLSLWRGEMCTASFRMPLNDVGRLIDTLDEGFAEAGGQEQDAGTGPFPQQDPAGQDGYAPQEGYPPHAQDQGQDAYATQVHDPYATQVHDPYAAESQDPYAAQDPYGASRDGHQQAPQPAYGQARDGYAEDGRDGYGGRDRRGARDGGRPEQPGASDYEYPDYPGTGQYARPPVPPPAAAPEAHPAPAALGPNDVLVARGTPTQDRLVASSSNRTAPQPGHPSSAQPGAPQPAGQQPGAVDPNDPLGLGPVRPYVSEQYGGETPLYTTGERLRPGQWQGGRAQDPHAEPERRGGRRAAQPSGEWPGDGEDNWGDTRAW